MTELLQQVFSGLSIGIVYGALALALCVVFQGTGVLNFAQGEMAVFSTLFAWQLIQFGLPFWFAVIGSVIASFLLGMGVERVLLRPVENSDPLSILMITLGLFLGINALNGLIWGHLPKQIAGSFGKGVIEVQGALVTIEQLGMTATILVVLAIVTVFFKFTNVGLRMRAAAQNPASSKLLAIRVGRQLMLGWGLAAAVGAVVGVISAPTFGTGVDSFSTTILLAFAAAALGGFTSRLGAVVAGLIVGVATNLGATYVPGLGGGLQLVVPFLLILLILLVRPQGLFGKAATGRV